jgi:hypothetical protein
LDAIGAVGGGGRRWQLEESELEAGLEEEEDSIYGGRPFATLRDTAFKYMAARCAGRLDGTV